MRTTTTPAPSHATLTAEQRRAVVAPATSAHVYGSITRKIGLWLAGPYATPTQRRAVATLDRDGLDPEDGDR